MSWTKLDLVMRAFSKIGYSNTFDLAPEQIEDAVVAMDAMVASWAAEGIRIGYSMASAPNTSKSTDDSGVIDAANEAVYFNLAKRIAGEFGKTLAQSDLVIAKQGYDALLNKVISRSVIPMQYPCGLPRGAGNKPWRNNQPFVTRPVDDLQVGPDDNLVLE